MNKQDRTTIQEVHAPPRHREIVAMAGSGAVFACVRVINA
jgi:hypothetical protein